MKTTITIPAPITLTADCARTDGPDKWELCDVELEIDGIPVQVRCGSELWKWCEKQLKNNAKGDN